MDSTREITKMHRAEAAAQRKEAATKASGGKESAALEEANRKVDEALEQLKEREFQVQQSMYVCMTGPRTEQWLAHFLTGLS